ncbi:TatD family hydrolase [Ignatzschineria larvae DSM 13226]|uniref:TatD family hydrolase n=1 Tax=Ignatzschineria larvae DSM 13226 TaxID=1111732 RepID=A0ABZ3BYV6_9GAMM|nr:TatD family hydrolase [Ignatzschineria larvae]
MTTMKPTFIDSHCHLDMLDLTAFEGDIAPLLETIKAENVTEMLCVGVNIEKWEAMAKLVTPYPNIYLSVGVHPGYIPEVKAPSETHFAPMLANPKVIAIGETGLDYHYGADHKIAQQAAFITQIEIARNHQKPLIIHTRDARADTISILKAEKADDVGGILHCFTENWEMGKKGLDLGFYLSFSGIITFKNASELREVVAKTPLDRMLIETDSPYLTPVPYRGKANHPGLVPYVAKMIAEVKQISVEEVARQTTDNFHKLFAKPISRYHDSLNS